MAGRHEVDDADCPLGGRPVGLEHHRPGLVAAGRGGHRCSWGDEPAAVIIVADQLGETAAGVEAGQAQPIHGPVPTYYGRTLSISDQCVVFYGLTHPAMIADQIDQR